MIEAVSIRRAREADLDAAAAVWAESAASADGAPTEPPSVTHLRERLTAELHAGWDLTVAVSDGEVVGLLAIRPAERVLDQLFVRPHLQRQGVGTALLKYAERLLPMGFTLRTATANHSARRFYEDNGLVLIAEGKHPHRGYPVCFYAWNVG